MTQTTIFAKLKQLIYAILICIIAWKYYKKFEKKVCDPHDIKCADQYFSKNYIESRQKFLSYSKKIKNANTYNIPIYTDKEDNILYTDITILNEDSNSEHLILHLSGVHGVEGYTGSAIQIALLEHMANPRKNNKFGSLNIDSLFDSNEKPIIILVHAMNPFGFNKTRRTNENNIDLNRNFKTGDEWDKFAKNGPNAFHYDDLNDLFNPNYRLQQFSRFLYDYKIPDKFHKYLINIYHKFNYFSVMLKLPYFVYKYGIQNIKIAGNVGQMHNEKGLQYVGDGKLANSHQKLKDFLIEQFEQHSKWKKQIKKITLIDVHSGDSSYGIDKLLTDKYEYALKLKRLFLDYDEYDLIQSLNSDQDNKDQKFMDGIYENANGYTFGYMPFIESLIDHNEKELDSLAFTSEFGSNHMVETVGFCQMLENGYVQEYNQYIKQENIDENIKEMMQIFVNKSKKWLKDVFYVQEPEWKKIVIQRGFRVFGGCLSR